MVERKNNRNLKEQNFKDYWKTRMEDGGSGIENQGSVKKKLENKRNKEIVDRGDVDRRLQINSQNVTPLAVLSNNFQ